MRQRQAQSQGHWQLAEACQWQRQLVEGEAAGRGQGKLKTKAAGRGKTIVLDRGEAAGRGLGRS